MRSLTLAGAFSGTLAGAFSGMRGMALYSAILHHACANRPPWVKFYNRTRKSNYSARFSPIPPRSLIFPFSIIIRVLGAESWTRNVAVFDLHMGGLDRKVGGLDRAWTAFGSPVDWLGQRLDRARPAVFFPLGRACTAMSHGFVSLWPPPSTGLDKDCTLLPEHSGRVGEGNNDTDMHVAVELLCRHAYQGMEPKRLRAQDNVIERTTNRKQ